MRLMHLKLPCRDFKEPVRAGHESESGKLVGYWTWSRKSELT